ncbi:hypothetical protein BDW59DRAFT_157941 [Aspergillus cavernicola]|uniref:Protein kinase domain-containing protein n=1 Tax=Aspergillus cavernicola TaxID=176166 RepID=A0ABR4IUS4_9EURO
MVTIASKTNAADSLRTALLSLRKKATDQRYFIPFPSLSSLLTRPAIANVVPELCHQPHRHTAVIDTIYERGIRVFAILLLLNQEQLVLGFLESGIHDAQLPVEPQQLLRASPLVSSRFSTEVQWEVISHVFEKCPLHQRIQIEVTLPYIAEEKRGEGSGGEIFQCVIAEGQHRLPTDGQAVVVRKKIKMIKKKEMTQKAFARELEALEVLRCLKHPNIIELLASYEYRGEYYLLFPLLAMDLSEFLTRHERYGQFEDDVVFCIALADISSAVQAIHDLNIECENILLSRIGYHHDIRPHNILVSETTFILTDFGLSRLKFPDEGSETLWKNSVGDYIAPECMDSEYNRMIIGRAIDIWSLGCLVAEVTTYMELGASGVTEFKAERFRVTERQTIVSGRFFGVGAIKPAVEGWFTRIAMNPAIRATRSLIEISRQMLRIALKYRPKASFVACSLGYVTLKMLYHKVRSLLEQMSCIGDNVFTPYGRLEIWFEEHRLGSWGRALGMENDGVYQELLVNDPELTGLLNVTLRSAKERLQELSETIKTDPSHLHELGDTIKPFVERLWKALPASYQHRMASSWRKSSLDTQDVQRLAEIEDKAHILPAPFSEIGRHAALKKLEIELWKQARIDPPWQLLLRDFQIERKQPLSNTHEVGWFEPIDAYDDDSASAPPRKRVLIEWVLYSPAWDGQSNEEKIAKMLALAELLHYPKPSEFHILECLGILPPNNSFCPQGFGFVYALPEDSSESEPGHPVTLDALLQTRNRNVLLEDKFRIAAQICDSLLSLHAYGWVHKNIQASNIIFSSYNESLNSNVSLASLPSPFLIGFQHSRPDGEIWYSETDIYARRSTEYLHPAYVPGKVRFKLIYDYYSIGILLLEIGFWEPVSGFRQRHRDLTAEEFSSILVSKYVPRLGPKMGSLYMGVVAACLAGTFQSGPGGSDCDDVDVSAPFYWTVVAPLQSVKVCKTERV